MLIPNEIGTLRAQPNGESLFVGSSSGVFFINTVRRAFSHAAATAPPSPQRNANDNVSSARTLASLPSPEDCILGSDPPTKESWFPSNIEDLGSLPDHAAAKELLITYFRTWHPLFPFLHGPTCLEDLESLYVGGQAIKPKSLSTAIIFQCLFSIAKLDRPEITSLGKSQIRSQRQLMLALSMISLNCDLVSTQALLAGQLYFVAIMDLRAASTAGGLVLQSMFKSGLHRCPFRYLSLKDDTREMRKRVFWSAYTLDRFVSQSLGHPLGIRDDDFDVCAPGDNDLHQPVRSTDGNHEGTTPKETILHLPANHPGRHGGSTCSSSDAHEHREEPATPAEEERPQDASPNRPGFENDQTSQRRRENQSIQAQFVRFSQLVGRMVEMFHKSIHARTASRHNILFLKADVDAWGNSLPYISTSTSARGSNPQTASFDQDIFFSVARQQLLLLVNRPSLSLDPTSAEFCHAAQICIGAARAIIRTLESHIDSGGLLFWPGFINAVWMSGLVMAFTCQLKLHSMTNAISDISASLKVLRTMTRRWRMTRNCCDVLSMLLENIQTPKASDIASANAFNQSLRTPRGHKRTREDTGSDWPSREAQSLPHDQQRRRPTRHSQQPVRSSSGPTMQRQAHQNGPIDLDGYQQYTQQNGGTSSGRSGIGNPQGLGLEDASTNMFNGPGYLATDFLGTDAFPQSNAQSSHGLQYAGVTDYSTFNNHHVVDWGLPTDIMAGSGSVAIHDVFNGAAWGPLLDLVDHGV